MSDELRGRLSQIIDRGLCCWDSDTKTSMTDTEYAAQAIIDDLGLTAEHGATHDDGWVHELEDQDEAEQMVRWNPGMHQVSRVVGRWERQ